MNPAGFAGRVLEAFTERGGWREERGTLEALSREGRKGAWCWGGVWYSEQSFCKNGGTREWRSRAEAGKPRGRMGMAGRADAGSLECRAECGLGLMESVGSCEGTGGVMNLAAGYSIHCKH